jgi:hypothetical protein
MLYDTLTYLGTEKSFAAWNFALDSVQDQLTNQANDVFSATIAGASIAAEADSPTFAFEQTVTVQINRTSATGATNSFSGGSSAFTGKRVENPARASGAGMGVTYKFHGPWYDLSNTHYLQSYMGQGGGTYLAAETILNTSTAVKTGQIQISLGDQIQAILQWCLDSYRAQGLAVPFAYVGRTLDTSVAATGAINLNVSSTAGTPGGNYSFTGLQYTYPLAASPTIDASLYLIFMPSYITKPLMCADALKKCLELSPRVTVWFDYTQSPPMIHFTAIDTVTAQSLMLFDGVSHKSLNLQARNDLLVNAVRILYRINNTSGGSPVINYSVDKWGPHGSNSASDPDYGLRVVNELIDLQGYARTYCTGHLDCEPLAGVGGTQATKRAWWSSPRGGGQRKLTDSKVRFQSTIPDAIMAYATTGGTDSGGNARVANQPLTALDAALFTNKLVRGTHHSWMSLGGGTPVVSLKVVVHSAMYYSEYDQVATGDTANQLPVNETTANAATNGRSLREVKSADHHAEMELTNGITGTYYTVATTVAGENWIAGYGGTAWYLYNQMNKLQYEGDFAKVEAAFGAGVSLGAPVNFAGGAIAWSSAAPMNAQIQEVRRQYGRHETSVRIGVARHLNSGQLSALLNMWRFRRPWYNPAVRSDNTAGGTGGLVDQPITSGNDNTTAGLENSSMTSVITYNTDGVPASGLKTAVIQDAVALTNNTNLNL